MLVRPLPDISAIRTLRAELCALLHPLDAEAAEILSLVVDDAIADFAERLVAELQA